MHHEEAGDSPAGFAPLLLPADFTGSLAVRKNGQLLYQACRGYANRSEFIPKSLHTRYQLATVSKVFTAVVILQLVEEGRLRVEDRLLALLPDLSLTWVSPDVTVHSLLTHTSGVPDYFDESVMDDYSALWKDRPIHTMRQPADFLPLMAKSPVQFAPGTAFRYNNGGFVLLALVVEKLTGLPFARACEERVFRKAGMHDAGYFHVDRMPSRCATGYREKEDGWVSNLFDLPPVGGGDGGAWCGTDDLFQFWEALANGTLLGLPLVSRMMHPHTEEPDGDAYGYGVWLKEMGGHHAWFLQGCDPGVSAVSLMDPVRGISFSVLGNTERAAWDVSGELIRRIVDGVL